MALSEHLIEVQFAKRADLVRVSRPEATDLELFVPSRQRVPLGRHIRLLVQFGDVPDKFELLGRVTFVRTATPGGAQPGMGVAFDRDEKRKAAALLVFCTGREPTEQPAAKRIYTRARCRIGVGADRYAGEVMDVSATGAFVTAPKIATLKAGSRVVLQFKTGLLSWGEPLELRVMWHGEKHGMHGFGGRFIGDAETVTAEVNRHLRPGNKGG